MATSAAAIWSSTRARPSAFVMALPPSASRTLMGRNLAAGEREVQRAHLVRELGRGAVDRYAGRDLLHGQRPHGAVGQPPTSSHATSCAVETA